MITLSLLNFKNYDRDSIHEYLLLQEETSFEIELKLSNVSAAMRHLPTQSNYTLAGYVAQLLSEISKRFTYNVPGVTATPVFKFRGTINDMDKLADVLFNTINGTYFLNTLSLKFHNEIRAFWSDICAYRIDPAAWGLIHAANRFVEGRDD